MEQKNFKEAINHEFGIKRPVDYKKALEYYRLAKDENAIASKKIKYSKFSIIELALLLISIVIGLVVDLSVVFPWLGLFIIGLSFSLIALFYLKKYWILTGYANIINNVILFVGIGIIIPYSVIKPYLNGITWIPIILLFVASIFIGFSSLVLYISDRRINFLVSSIIGFILLLGSIISFNIKTPDKLFIFRKIDGGIEITGYRDRGNKIVIPEKISGYDVISIGSNAFENWQFEEVIFNSKIKNIGANAFKDNRVLKEIVIPDGVTIGMGAFTGNHSLEKLVLPKDLKVIPFAMCMGCSTLESIKIPNTVIQIQDMAFANTSIKDIVLPSELVVFGNDVFAMTSIQSLNLPNSIKYLGRLSNMPSLQTFNFPSSITSLPTKFLYGNQNIKHLEVPLHIKNIGDYAFSNTNIESISLHDEITYGEGLFYQAKNFKSFTFPSSMNYIPKDTFAFSGIESIIIPSFIKVIGINAFAYARSLASLTIESGVISIETGAFMYIESIIEVVIPDTVQSLGTSVFKGAYKLKKITLPQNLKTLPDRFLEDAYALNEINLVDGITIIGKNSLKNTSITNVVLPKSLQIIDDYAFFGNKLLETVVFNDQLKEIRTHSFGSNISLKVLDFPNSLLKIDDYSFNGAINLETIYIKENVEFVGYWAFRSNTSMVIHIINNPYVDLWSSQWNPYSASVIIA